VAAHVKSSTSRRFLAFGLGLLVEIGHLCAGTQTVTGMEVVVDPPIADAVRTLHLQDRIGSSYSREEMVADVKRLQDLGLVSRVLTDVEDHEGGKKLFFKVEANPRVESIEVVGNELIPTHTLLAKFETRPGTILDYRRLYEDVNRIAQVYLEHGLMYAQVSRHSDVKIDGGQIRIQVEEYRMGQIEMSGIRPEEARIVRRELKLKAGEPVEKNRLLASLHDVYRLPFISNVEFTPRFDREHKCVNLLLEITPDEARRPWVVSQARNE